MIRFAIVMISHGFFLVFWKWDFLVIMLTLFSVIFMKKHRKTILLTYAIFNLTLTSYVLGELFWLFLAFILLLKLPYFERNISKKEIGNLYKIRKGRVFKGILVVFFLISLKNYIYYGTNVLNFIYRPIKLSLKKIKLEREIGEFIWIVWYSENLNTSGYHIPRIKFRTKDFFPVDEPIDVYQKKLESDFFESEKEVFDKYFPYEKDIKIYHVQGDYKNNLTYEDIKEMSNEELKERDFYFTFHIRIQEENFEDEKELDKLEKSIYDFLSYYAQKNYICRQLNIRIYPKESQIINLQRKMFQDKSSENLKFFNYYEKWKKEVKKWNRELNLKPEEFKELKSYKDLRKKWEIKGGS